jgi:hypothetical protein
MGIVPEVSAQTYGTLAKALREYVANAVDADAKSIWITLAANAAGGSILDIRDDGRGMTLLALQRDFLALGGSGKYEDQSSIGRIGIGFLAIVPLCKSITILTKSQASSEVVRAVIDTETMLPPHVRTDAISKRPIGEAEVLEKGEARRAVQAFGNSFTVFTLEDLAGDVREEFQNASKFERFRDELRLILPLPWPTTAPLKGHLSKNLWDALRSKAAKHSIQVFLNDPNQPLTRKLYGDNASRETFLYTQEFIDVTMVAPDKNDGQTEQVRVTGFLVCDEPVVGKPIGAKLTGVIARFQNIAVEEGTYFGLEGKEERKKRLSGEMFVEGLDKNLAMVLNRNEFSETYRPVIRLNVAMAETLSAFFAGINRVWKARSDINRGVRGVRSVLNGVESAMRTIHSAGGDPKDQKKIKWSRPALLKHPARRTFTILADAVNASHLDMSVDPEIKADEGGGYRIALQDSPHEQLKGRVLVSPELAYPSRTKFTIAGVEYRLRLVSGTVAEPPCSLDIRERFIVLNDTHPLVRLGDKSMMQTLVFIAYASEVCENPAQMKQLLIQLMTQVLE